MEWGIRGLDVVTWIVLVAGWFIVDRLARRREKISTHSATISNAVAVVEEVEEFAIDYWLAPGTSPQDQQRQRATMINKTGRLERRVAALGERCPRHGLNDGLIAFQRALLDGDGESLDRSPLEENDPRLNRVNSAAEALIGKLNTCRN